MVPDLDALLAEVHACRLCADHLPLGPRPVVQASPGARVLVVGQAPGTRVHETGLPWNDPSGDRLREWMAVDRETFYGSGLVAVTSMAFCYPGRDRNGGDRPPRPECAPLWHGRLRAALADVRVTLLVGAYAQSYYLGPRAGKTMTETVRRWRDYLPEFLVTPHPSWRTTGWLKRNPWFAADVVPELGRRIGRALTDGRPVAIRKERG